MAAAHAQCQGIGCAIRRQAASEQGMPERRWALLVRCISVTTRYD